MRRFYRAAVRPLLLEVREILTHPVRWARRVDQNVARALRDWSDRMADGLG